MEELWELCHACEIGGRGHDKYCEETDIAGTCCCSVNQMIKLRNKEEKQNTRGK